jgi:transposase
MKAVPGRKTDVQDAEWIADLLQHGLLTASFVPNQEQQDVRDLTRLRVSRVQERTRLVNRVHKVLEEAGFKLSNVRSSVMGVGGTYYPGRPLCRRKRSNASGQVDAAWRACQPRASDSRSDRRSARASSFRGSQELLTLIDAQDRTIKHLEREIERHLPPFEEQVRRCEKINGVSRQVLYVLSGRDRNGSVAFSRC